MSTSTPIEFGRLLSMREVQAISGIQHRKLSWLVSQGKMPKPLTDVGYGWKWPEGAIKEWLRMLAEESLAGVTK